MKKLILILILLVSFFCKAQENIKLKELYTQEDKINHLTVGYMIGFMGNCTAYEISKNKTIGVISGFALSVLAGHLKEVYDMKNGKSYNKKDFQATIIGGFSGTITIRLVLWNSVHKKKATMEQYFLIND